LADYNAQTIESVLAQIDATKDFSGSADRHPAIVQLNLLAKEGVLNSANFLRQILWHAPSALRVQGKSPAEEAESLLAPGYPVPKAPGYTDSVMKCLGESWRHERRNDPVPPAHQIVRNRAGDKLIFAPDQEDLAARWLSCLWIKACLDWWRPSMLIDRTRPDDLPPLLLATMDGQPFVHLLASRKVFLKDRRIWNLESHDGVPLRNLMAENGYRFDLSDLPLMTSPLNDPLIFRILKNREFSREAIGVLVSPAFLDFDWGGRGDPRQSGQSLVLRYLMTENQNGHGDAQSRSAALCAELAQVPDLRKRLYFQKHILESQSGKWGAPSSPSEKPYPLSRFFLEMLVKKGTVGTRFTTHPPLQDILMTAIFSPPDGHAALRLVKENESIAEFFSLAGVDPEAETARHAAAAGIFLEPETSRKEPAEDDWEPIL
jgi:hypothetical protein